MECVLPYQSVMRLELGRQFLRFGAIGVINTLIHLGVVLSLVEVCAMGPLMANGLAFVAANVFSFWANSRFTFRAITTWKRYSRFLLVSMAGLLLAVGASYVNGRLGFHYLWGVALSFVLLPVLSFAANRFWTWKDLSV